MKGIILAYFRALSGEQVRQIVNVEQVYEAFRLARNERDQRFRGSMSWKTVGGKQYLYRKVHDQWISLGPRSEETEQTRAQFVNGRDAAKSRIKNLEQRIRDMAPVNRAMRLGRVAWPAARIIRKIDRSKMSASLSIVGTHALFVYERLAGGHFDRSAVATDDLDFLFDARRRMRLVGGGDQGLIGALRAVDPSFAPVAPGSYRAVDSNGFMVDLIQPMPRSPAMARPRNQLTADDELTAAEIEGLSWLQNSPQVEQIAIDERGYPLSMKVPDPRAFALHKWWVAERPSRDRAKAMRDRVQAIAVAGLVIRYLPAFSFEDSSLQALPLTLREQAPQLIERARVDDSSDGEAWN